MKQNRTGSFEKSSDTLLDILIVDSNRAVLVLRKRTIIVNFFALQLQSLSWGL